MSHTCECSYYTLYGVASEQLTILNAL